MQNNLQNNLQTYDVIIVGAGPVGLLLAGELRHGGVSVLVLEAEKNQSNPLKSGPLGIRGLSIATVETFYRRKLLDSLRSLTDVDSNNKNGSSSKEKRGGHFAGIGIDFTKVDPSQFLFPKQGPASAPMAASMQHLEEVLTAHAEALGAVIHYDSRVQGITPHVGEVDVKTAQSTYRARWVVGCDGGRSQIRKLAGFEFTGTEAEFTAYAALVKVKDPAKLLPGRNFTPQGFYMQAQPGYISVMEFDGGKFDRSEGVSREHFEKVLRRVSGTDVTISELTLATSYTDRAKAATSLRKGLVLLAGDAAHIHSPLGGQGINVGLGDALNLGWKLAATIRGEAGAQLLDSYHLERHPVAEWVLTWTRAQVQLMKPDPHSRALRDIMFDLMQTKDGATYFADKLWSASLRYDLNVSHPLVGQSVPDILLEDGSRIGEHFENGKGIFLSLNSNFISQELANRYSDRIKFISSIGRESASFDAVLVRPDGVVCWIAEPHSQSGDLKNELVRWFGD